MKNACLLLGIVLFGAVTVFAQTIADDKHQLVRLVTKDQHFSMVLPVQQTLYVTKDRTTVWATDEKVRVTVTRYKRPASQRGIMTSYARPLPDSTMQSFAVDDYVGALTKFEYPRSISSFMVFSNRRWTYSVSVSANIRDVAAYQRYLTSIKIRGQSVLHSDAHNTSAESTAEVVLDELKTSEVISEFLRVPVNKRPLVRYEVIPKPEVMQAEPDNSDQPKEDRVAALILEKPKPPYTNYARERNKQGIVRAKVQLLANGQIGEIIVDPTLDKGLAKNAVKAISKIRFVPATLNGQYVDSRVTIEYGFSIY